MACFILWAWLLGLLGKMGAGMKAGGLSGGGGGAGGIMGSMGGKGSEAPKQAAPPVQMPPPVQPAPAAPPPQPPPSAAAGTRLTPGYDAARGSELMGPKPQPGTLDRMREGYGKYRGVMDELPENRDPGSQYQMAQRPMTAQSSRPVPDWAAWLDKLRSMQYGGAYRR